MSFLRDYNLGIRPTVKVCRIKSNNPNRVPTKTINIYCFDTPLGKLFCAADESVLYIIAYDESPMLAKRFPQLCDELGVRLILEIKNDLLYKVEDELKAYFDGTLKKFTVPIKTFGTTLYQSVWQKLQELPYGMTVTYSDFTKMLGCPASHARAISHAFANNLHHILIPCHRVVTPGSRGGFGLGPQSKAWLINHEKKYAG